MKKIVEFSVEGQGVVPVEVDDHGYGYSNVSRRAAADEESPRSFQEALERVRPMADQLVRKLRELAAQPDQVEVEFGIKLSGTVGALIAATSTEANFTVKLLWKKPS